VAEVERVAPEPVEGVELGLEALAGLARLAMLSRLNALPPVACRTT
jgi:hypothetical protein